MAMIKLNVLLNICQEHGHRTPSNGRCSHCARRAVMAPDPTIDFTAGTPREFLSFRLGDEDDALDISRVQQIRSDEKPAGCPADGDERPQAARSAADKAFYAPCNAVA